MMQEFFERVDNAFGMIKADTKWSTFTINAVKLLGVNKLIESYIPPFDKVTQSAKTAEKWSRERGVQVTPEQVIAEWNHKGKVSTVLGINVHSYLEAAIANKFYRYDDAAVMKEFPNDTSDPVRDRYNRIILQVDSFRESIRGKLIPVLSEQVVGSPKYMVCGIVDQIFWNKKANEFQIWDWKTNEKFELSSNFKFNPPFEHLSNCEYHKYSLQLNMYKKLFMEATGIPIGQCYLCWFSSEAATQQMFPVQDFSNEVTQMLAMRAQQLGLVDQGSVF
jgi:hypothetical protein